MNEIVNKSSLAGDEFISEIHSRQPEITFRAPGSFTKNKKKYKNLKKLEIHNIFIKMN